MAAFPYDPTGAVWTPGDVDSRITTPVNSDVRQVTVSLNQLCYGLQNVLAALGGSEVPMTTSVLSIGANDIDLAATASFISINGVNGSVAALTAQAFGALGTIPASTWGLIKVERIADGTTTFQSAAANYSTGYATEALAIAAMPATGANEVAIGYLTILASASGFVVGTDALEGGTGGNPATTTNYYSFDGAVDATNPAWEAVLQIANGDDVVVTATVG